MRSSAVLSVAFVAAAVMPVMSAPVPTQPTQTALAAPPYANMVDGFLESLSPAQLQELSTLIQAAEKNGQNGGSPTPTATTNPSESNHPEKRHFGAVLKGVKNVIKGVTKGATKAANAVTNGKGSKGDKRDLAPAAIVEPIHPFLGVGPVVLPNHEADRRSIFGTIGKEAAKFGEGQAAAAIQSALKRAPAPTPIAEPFPSHFYGVGPEEVHERDLSGLINKAKSTIEGGIADLKSHLKRSEEMDERDLSGLIDKAKSTIEGGIADLESHLKRALSRPPTKPNGPRPMQPSGQQSDDLGTELAKGWDDLKSHLKRSDDLEEMNERSFSGFLHDVEGTIGEIKSHLRRSIMGDVTGFVDKTKNSVEHDVSAVESDVKSHLKRSYIDEVYLD